MTIVLVALDSACAPFSKVPKAFFLPNQQKVVLLGVPLYAHGCLPAIGVP